jgi:hypothetical protein
MKNLMKLTLGLLVTLFISCDNTEVIDNSNSINKIEQKKSIDEDVYNLENLSKMIQSKVTIKCNGSCDCRVEGTSTMEGPIEVHCSCDDCSMDIEFEKTNNSGIDKEKLYRTITKFDLFTTAFNDLKKYAKKTYDTNVTKIDKIEFNTNGKTIVITLFFTDKNNIQNSVLYSETFSSTKQLHSKILGKKYRIDCTGSCGCREQYHFDTNTSSCSCDDCSMTVEEID